MKASLSSFSRISPKMSKSLLSSTTRSLSPDPNFAFRWTGSPKHSIRPRFIIPILELSASASSIECVLNTRSLPLPSFLMVDQIWYLVSGSNPVVGSSMKTMSGLPATLMAMLSRRRIPPLSAVALVLNGSPSKSQVCAKRLAPATAFATPLALQANSRCSLTVNVGYRTSCCGQTPIFSLTRTGSRCTSTPPTNAAPPPSWLIIVVNSEKRVVLPAPFGPKRQKHSSASMDTLTPSTIQGFNLPYRFFTPSVSNKVPSAPAPLLTSSAKRRHFSFSVSTSESSTWSSVSRISSVSSWW
mmetsp:Transcript_8185/g.14856  ORF Transcript_8185/g.14856 Transcript_8185/m.14856 type:complete len:299 (+) Transcript_8185:133-1029(+)